jgi:cyanate permease
MGSDIINNNDVNIMIQINSSYLLWIMIFFMGFSEILYYCIKTEIINNYKNENYSSSVFINILDITRRVVTLIVGIILFNDVYNTSYFVCFSFICCGCVFIQFSNIIEKYIC